MFSGSGDGLGTNPVFLVETTLRSRAVSSQGPGPAAPLDWSTILRIFISFVYTLVALALASNVGAASEPTGVVPLRTRIHASAAAFVDSVGVNVHLSYHDGPYGDEARRRTPLARLAHSPRPRQRCARTRRRLPHRAPDCCVRRAFHLYHASDLTAADLSRGPAAMDAHRSLRGPERIRHLASERRDELARDRSRESASSYTMREDHAGTCRSPSSRRRSPRKTRFEPSAISRRSMDEGTIHDYFAGEP